MLNFFFFFMQIFLKKEEKKVKVALDNLMIIQKIGGIRYNIVISKKINLFVGKYEIIAGKEMFSLLL